MPVPPTKHPLALPRNKSRAVAKALARRWLLAHSTAERVEVRRLLFTIKNPHKAAHIAALVTAELGPQAHWFADFIKN